MNFPGHNISCHAVGTAEASCDREPVVHNRLFRGFIFMLVLLFCVSAFAATCPRCFNESPRVIATKTEAVSNPVRGAFAIQRTEYKCGKCANKFRKVEEIRPALPVPVFRSPNDSRL